MFIQISFELLLSQNINKMFYLYDKIFALKKQRTKNVCPIFVDQLIAQHFFVCFIQHVIGLDLLHCRLHNICWEHVPGSGNLYVF